MEDVTLLDEHPAKYENKRGMQILAYFIIKCKNEGL
jgi:hypothetical protein